MSAAANTMSLTKKLGRRQRTRAARKWLRAFMGYGMEEEYNMALDGVQMGLVLGHYCRGLNSTRG